MYYVGTYKFLNITEHIDYFLDVFFFAGVLHAPFDFFPEVPHFFIAITNHPLS
jgi:hypothetical protein